MAVKRLLLTFIFIGSVAACATPYSRAIDVENLSSRMVEITSAGNSDTNIAKIRDYSKLAAASICKNRGFSHFSELRSETAIASISFGGLSRAARYYFYGSDEEIPVTAVRCSRTYARLAPKYIGR